MTIEMEYYHLGTTTLWAPTSIEGLDAEGRVFVLWAMNEIRKGRVSQAVMDTIGEAKPETKRVLMDAMNSRRSAMSDVVRVLEKVDTSKWTEKPKAKKLDCNPFADECASEAYTALETRGFPRRETMDHENLIYFKRDDGENRDGEFDYALMYERSKSSLGRRWSVVAGQEQEIVCWNDTALQALDSMIHIEEGTEEEE